MDDDKRRDLIIKLHLQSGELDHLLDLADGLDVPLSQLFTWFVEDLLKESGSEAAMLEEWLEVKAGSAPETEDEMYESVQFTDQQLEMMRLLDLIMDN